MIRFAPATGRRLVAALLLAAACAVGLTAPAGAATKTKTTKCKGRRIQVRIGSHHGCLKAAAPAATPAAQQRAFDRALLATRLKPRGGHGKGRTIGSWLGSSRKGLTALEHALAAAPAAHASAATGRGSASSSWKTSVADRTPAGAAGSALEIVARHGRAKLTLDTSYVAKAEHCADAAGEDPGTRTRKISLKLVVPLSGGRTLTVSSSQSTSASFTGTANDAAMLAKLVLGKVKTKASSKAELRDAHGKLLARLSPTRASATISIPTALGTTVSWPEVLTDPQTAFIASSALKELLDGDGSSSLNPLLRRFVLDMQTDVWSTYEQARGALLDVQDGWWRAGKCLYLALETPSGAQTTTGGHLPVRVTAILTSEPKRPKHRGVGPLPLTVTTSAGSVAPGTATTKATTAGQADPLTFDVTAPGEPASPTVTVSVVSKQGTATASVPLTVVSSTVHLKVTAVSGFYDMTFHVTGHSPDCMYDSHDHYDLTLGSSSGEDGLVNDTLGLVIVPTQESGQATGTVDCPGTGDDQSCTRSLDGPGSYYLDINHAAGAPTATLSFHALQQPYNDCYSVVQDGGETTGQTNPTIDTTVPWSQIVGTAPFTVHAEGTFSDNGHKVTRNYTVTLQRIG